MGGKKDRVPLTVNHESDPSIPWPVHFSIPVFVSCWNRNVFLVSPIVGAKLRPFDSSNTSNDVGFECPCNPPPPPPPQSRVVHHNNIAGKVSNLFRAQMTNFLSRIQPKMAVVNRDGALIISRPLHPPPSTPPSIPPVG